MKVYGFDSFSGFPPGHDPMDNFSKFEEMYEKNQIGIQQIKAV